MIVNTDHTKLSGPGTAMFSRTGKETITANPLYQQTPDQIPAELGGTKVSKSFRQYEAQADKEAKRNFQPNVYQDKNFIKKQLNQPQVRFENEGKQNALMLPGLEEELTKLEQIYPQIQQNKMNNDLNPKGIQPQDQFGATGAHKIGGLAATGMDSSLNSRKSLRSTSIGRLNEEEPTAKSSKPKINRQIGQSSAFQAVDRSVMAVNDSVYGMPTGPDLNTYAPNHELVKPTLSRNASFKKEFTHEARTPRMRIIECERDKSPCSLKKRQAISYSTRRSPRSPGKTQNSDYDIVIDAERHGATSQLTVWEENESSLAPMSQQKQPSMNDDINRQVHRTDSSSNFKTEIKIPTQKLLVKQIQEQARRGIRSLDFKKLTSRHPNSIMQQQRQAIPSDSRFEPIKSNIELITKHRNTKLAPNLKVAPRTELFGKPQAQQDYVIIKNLDKVKQRPPGQLDFGKRLAHDSPEIKRNFVVPDTYDTEKLQKAFNMTSNLKNPKALISMNRSAARDNILYKLDEDYVSDLKRQTRKKSFGIADYLPNSVRRKSEWQDSLSRNNQASVTRFNQSTHQSTFMPQIRHGSISELGSGISNIGLLRSTNPSMSQLGKGFPNQRSKASIASGQSRSTSTSAFVLPSHIVPVNGSFLFFDEEKKRLSDLGQYKTNMKNQPCSELANDIFDKNKQKRIAPGVALRQ